MILKEEVHITKRQQEIHKPQRVTLGSEEASIKRNPQARKVDDQNLNQTPQ